MKKMKSDIIQYIYEIFFIDKIIQTLNPKF